MLPNFSVVRTNVTTMYTSVSSCPVVRALRTSSCGRLTAPYLKQYWNGPCVETVFVCLLLCVSVVHSGSVTVALCCTCRLKQAAKCADVRYTPSATPFGAGEWIWYDVSAEHSFSRCFCRCETWSLTLKEERRLRVFENSVLRRIFGPKRDEVKGEWRKLHS
jgi:hypothetical protein